MSTPIWTLIGWICRALLALRYRITIRGLKTLTPERLDRKQGILFMPNHPALMDPLFVFLLLWPKFRMRPLVVEYIFNTPLLKPLNRLVRALPVPNFDSSVNEYKIKRANQTIEEMKEGLKRGENFIVYPSGQLKSGGKELIGGSAAAHEMLKACPDANVVLIRTVGLWGSSFSRAIIGKSPPLAQTLKAGLRSLFKNLVFFAPRRSVTIDIEPNPKDLPRGDASRLTLNRFLEKWYNRYPDAKGQMQEVEPLSLVSYAFWKQEIPQIAVSSKKQIDTKIKISDKTKQAIVGEIRKILDQPNLEITTDMNLAFDLGMDSLNIAELITFVTKRFDVRDLHPEDLETVGTILAIAEGGEHHRAEKEPPPTFTWKQESHRPSPALPIGRTIPEAFLRSCGRMRGFQACGDDVSGVFGYNRLKKSVLVLAQFFKGWEEERIAVMLPASVGAYIAILAIQMAGKVPVMLNWTLGPRYLEEMMKLSGAQRIVSSWRFLDRLSNVQFGSCIDRFVLLEEIREKLSLAMKLKGLWLSHRSIPCVLKKMGLDQRDENHPCVILFTSGTEAVPKGVPLSHKNIISNQRSAMQCLDLCGSDTLYGILPPFHSFGFSVAGLFPIMGGMRLAFYPDPTDSFALAEGIKRWKITLFCGAPSFLKGLFNVAKLEDLKTVRYFVSGAEKAPQELRDKVEGLGTHAKLLEGYGITECSPILSLNRPHVPPKGVGRLAPQVELITIHPETLERLPERTDGEICVRGDNVFHGYLGNPRSPFIQIDGKQWYRTGDLGHLDEEGNLILSGRLKRFTKIGGEMISLGAIEEILTTELIRKGKISPNVPSLAVVSDEKIEGKPRLVLMTIIAIQKEEANQILQDAGFSNLVKIADVKQIEAIPIMGAGKTDYRTLQNLC